MTAKQNDNDVNRREYWERAVSNPKEHELTDRQAQAMRESLTLTDPEYWEKVLAAPETYGLNAEQAKQLTECAMKPRHERNQLTPAEEIEAEAGFHEAFYGAEHVRTWLEMGAVSPMNAALLLNSKNPSKYRGTPPDFGEAFDLMILAFEDTARDGRDRNLRDWLSVARDRELTGHDVPGWTACSQAFLAERASLAQQADSQSPVAPLAASEPQAVPVVAVGASDDKPPTNWRHLVQAEAYEHWLRLRASGCNPTVHSICEDMAKWCVKHNIKGDKGQNPRAGTIRNAVLSAGHWTPPTHSVEQAKKYVAQIAQTAQTKVAQTAR